MKSTPRSSELAPVDAFSRRLQERRRLYTLLNVDGVEARDEFLAPDSNANLPAYGDFIQGVGDDCAVFALSPAQTGVLATFAPPMKGHVANNALLLTFRR